MTISTILAPGLTEATSTDVAVPAGAVVTIGIYASTESTVPLGSVFTVLQATPGADTPIGVLSKAQGSVQVTGPGTFRVKRTASTGRAFGVFKDV